MKNLKTCTFTCLRLGLVASLLTLSSLAFPENSVDSKFVSTVDSVGITVSDMDRAVDFYSHVLSFKKVSDREIAGEQAEHLDGVFGLRERIVRMTLGDEAIELTQFLAQSGRPIPVDSKSNDRWFQHIAIIVSDMDKAYAWLRKNNIRHASSGPQRLPDWNKNAGGIQAFYFKDPDDQVLEILQFPEGKGKTKWHRPSNRLFLGIDHTAIVVNDTDESLRFYQDILGFSIAGTSENYGTEQEHLNNVFGARLRITSLTCGSGPSIEFLQYLAPAGGRPYPSDSHSNDLWSWQTHLVSRRIDELGRKVVGRLNLISPGTIDLDPKQFGFEKGLLARDPDGHAIKILQPAK